MTADTLVQATPATTGEYQHVPGKCVLDLVVRALRIPLVRVRLRVISAMVELGDTGRAGLLVAEIASKPLFGNLPFSRRWALASVPRPVRIRVSAELPAPDIGRAVRIPATAAAGARTWAVSLDVRSVFVDEDSIVLAVRGRVARPPGVLLLASHLFVDAAAEFVR